MKGETPFRTEIVIVFPLLGKFNSLIPKNNSLLFSLQIGDQEPNPARIV